MFQEVGDHMGASSPFPVALNRPVTARSKWVRPKATPEDIQRLIDNLPWHVSSRIWVSQSTGCWLWAGADSGSGRGGEYGRVSIDGKTTAVHIYLYTRLFGPIKGKRKYLDHTCRARNCCNPEHLEQVTHRMNCARRDAAQRKLRRQLVSSTSLC